MTITDEGKQLRAEVAKLRPDKRRRYPAELRRRILEWLGRAETAGLPIYECSRALGIKTWRFQTWRESERRAATKETTSLPLVPIDAPPPLVSPVVVVAPLGHRIEGLALHQIVALLRELG